jgi:hypothetical protein
MSASSSSGEKDGTTNGKKYIYHTNQRSAEWIHKFVVLYSKRLRPFCGEGEWRLEQRK